MKNRRIVASFLVGLVASTAMAGPALGADPANAPVTLANGKVLPAPPSPFAESVHAKMLAQYPDAPPLQKGAQPTVELAQPGTGRMAADGLSGSVSSVGPAGSLPNRLRKEVLGFLPYWMLDANTLSGMRYDLVSTIAYFGIAARSDGYLTKSGATWTGWTSSALTSVVNARSERPSRRICSAISTNAATFADPDQPALT